MVNINEAKNSGKFKKFSQISGFEGSKDVEVELPVEPFGEDEIPQNPNLPYRKTRQEQTADISYMQPEGQFSKNKKSTKDEDKKVEENVEFYGKVAKFPKKVKASNAYNFLEKVKISKNSIWYILVEKQDNELQMVKYNYQKGVDLANFVNELKGFYLSKYQKDSNISKLIENITVGGNDKFSVIQNIPQIEVEGRKMVSRITEDLIKLLSK
jgi:hypothetical protein